jgi:hypothetical protein
MIMQFKVQDKLKRCEECKGCLQCGVTHCLYQSNGNSELCYFEICRYCMDYMQKPKMFLNNVG